MKKILFIAHAFHPSNHANATRPFLEAKAFLEKGWDVEVLASGLGILPGAEEAFSESNQFRVIRLNDPLSRLHDWLSRRDGWLYKKVDSMLLALAWPDLPVFWGLKAAWWLRNKKHDAIVCSIQPKSVLLLPLLMKRVKASWVIDYQDSVSAQFKRYPRKSPIHRVLTPVLAKIEKVALSRVDRAMFTSESNRQAYISDGLVAPEKTGFIPQFFEESLYDRSLRWDGESFNIIYAGNFDRTGRRTPEVFLKALGGFLKKHSEAIGKVRFDFYGRWWPEHGQFVEALELQDIVKIHPAVPYEEYLKVLQTSAMLLLVTSPVHNLFIPGKLTDYLGACRPILAFTPLDSETRRILCSANVKSYICSDEDVSEGVQMIEQLWADYCERNLSSSTLNDVAEWSSDVLGGRFVKNVGASLLRNRGVNTE